MLSYFPRVCYKPIYWCDEALTCSITCMSQRKQFCTLSFEWVFCIYVSSDFVSYIKQPLHSHILHWHTHTLKHSVMSLLTAPLWTFAERCGMQWVEMRFCLWHTNTLWKLSALLRSVHFIMRSLKDWCIVCVSLLVGLNWCTPFTKNRI